MDEVTKIRMNEILSEYLNEKIVEMKGIVPVRTGRLRDSFITENTIQGMLVKNEAPYAGFVDQGTKYQSAQNFTRPLYDGLPELEQKILDALGEIVLLQLKGEIEKGIKIK